MILHKPHLLTVMDIWAPRYSDQYAAGGQWIVLLSRKTVSKASPVILVEFSKAKHMKGTRHAIRRSDVEKCPLGSNGKIACWVVDIDKFESWETAAEVRDLALAAFEDQTW